jgi:uncharacterized membrane protein
MNRAFYIIFAPVLLVLIGYILVFRVMGVSPGYPRLAFVVIAFAAALWWLGTKATRKADSGRR